jgi:hypothetical protein
VPFNKSHSVLQLTTHRNPNTIENEADCIDVWMHEISCECNFEINNENKMQTIRNNRNLMKRRELRRNLFIDKETSMNANLAKPETIWNLRKTIELSDEEDDGDNNYELADDDNDEIFWSCNASDNEDTEDLFLTPPESPLNFSDLHIDDKMLLNVIDYNIFIEG